MSRRSQQRRAAAFALYQHQLTGRDLDDVFPREASVFPLELARFIVARSHGQEAARRAEEHFTRVVREGRAPEDVPEVALPAEDPVHLPRVLSRQLGITTSQARRLIDQGAVRLNGEPVAELDVAAERLRGALLQAGKRQFMRFAAS